MDTKLIIVIFHALLLSLLFHSETSGSPVQVQLLGKPPNCPYGECFIDRCQRICSCMPTEGNIICVKEPNYLLLPLLKIESYMACEEVAQQDGNCPLGETYKPLRWDKNFLCYCNNDPSQTYECIDLDKQTSANYRDLMESIKRNRKQISSKINSSGQKRN